MTSSTKAGKQFVTWKSFRSFFRVVFTLGGRLRQRLRRRKSNSPWIILNLSWRSRRDILMLLVFHLFLFTILYFSHSFLAFLLLCFCPFFSYHDKNKLFLLFFFFPALLACCVFTRYRFQVQHKYLKNEKEFFSGSAVDFLGG